MHPGIGRIHPRTNAVNPRTDRRRPDTSRPDPRNQAAYLWIAALFPGFNAPRPLQVPTRRVGLADSVYHLLVIRLDVDAQSIVEHEAWWIYIIDVDRDDK